jgi:hypothetical protein
MGCSLSHNVRPNPCAPVPGRAHAHLADLDAGEQAGDDDPSIVEPVEVPTDAA